MKNEEEKKKQEIQTKTGEEKQALMNLYLNHLFTSDQERYDQYKDDPEEYVILYENLCTENCLDTMEFSELFTYVDYLADEAGSTVTVEKLEIYANEASEDISNDYFFVATLNNTKGQETNSFTVQGKLVLAKWSDGWKINFVSLSDYEALSIYVTGKRMNAE